VQDKLCRLVVLCHVFAADNYYAKPEDQVLFACQERYSEDLTILQTYGLYDQQGASQPYTSKLMEYFNTVCPKFLSVLPGSSSSGEGQPQLNEALITQIVQDNFSHLDSHNAQWGLFWKSCESVKNVPRIRSLLRMYTRVSLDKLAKLIGINSGEGGSASKEAAEAQVREILVQVKKHQNQFVMQRKDGGGVSILPGVPERCTDVDFKIDESKKEVLVTILKPQKNLQDTFLKEISKLEDLHSKLGSLSGKGSNGLYGA